MIITYSQNRNINVPEQDAMKSDWKVYLDKLRKEFPRGRARTYFKRKEL